MISDVKLMDNIKFMQQFDDNFFDLVTADPPFGRGEDGGVDRTSNVGGVIVKAVKHKKKNWDKTTPKKKYFDELIRVSKHQIIFGVNYYNRVFGPGRIIWDKCNDGSDQSSCEIAYNSMNSRVDMFRYMWRGHQQGKSITEGWIQQGNKKLNEKKIHPTQKPVALYSWIFQKYAKPGWKIIDPNLGSQSSRIAAFELGLDFYGCENDEDYFNDGNSRYEEYISGRNFFPGLIN